MRVPPPASLRLDRRALLAEVRAHLGEHLPAWVEAAADDPTEPGWLLLEQVAWMTEMLSEQLDRYPFAVLQQLVHLMNGRLRPAVPAVGVVVVEPAAAGPLEQAEDRPERVRFFAPQTERRDAVSFVCAERRVALRPGGVHSVCRVEEGALVRVGAPRGGGLGQRVVAADGAPAPVAVFEEEVATWTMVGARSEELARRVGAAANALVARGVGWLRLEVRVDEEQQVVLTARVSPDDALLAAAPSGLAPGGDLEIPWGRLDDSTWTPPTRVADRPTLPLPLRRTAPLPGDREGRLVVPNLPADEPLRGLLQRKAAPLPRAVLAAIWHTLVNQDAALASLRPTLRHGLAGRARAGAAGEPGWVDAALADGRWGELAVDGRLLAELRLPPDGRGAGTVRVGLLLPPGVADVPSVRAMALAGGRLQHQRSPCTTAWELPVPPTSAGHRLQRLVALDVEVDDDADAVLLCVDGAVQAVLMDCLLVVNAPAVEERRELRVERAAPEAVRLGARDVVGPGVVEALLEAPLPASTRATLAGLPLAWADVDASDTTGRAGEDGPIRDFGGVSLDPTAGLLTLNSPDDGGAMRRLRPGARVDLRWYRRTDGALGNLPAGTIRQVDQSSRHRPRILAVDNPVATLFGADREADEAAVRRMFGGAEPLPVVPSDWERAIRRELGPEAAGWIVRCWSHAERSLVARATWGDEDGALRAALASAGPETLLVVLGPAERALDEQALDRARQVVEGLVQRIRRRMPAVRAAVVTRCWPLTLVGRLGPDVAGGLPTMDLFDADGELVDERGERRPLPAARLLLDAAVVRVLPAGGLR